MSNPLHDFMVARRAQLGYTQKDAALKVPCSVNTWGRWESTIRLPHPGAWLKIAKVLNVPLAVLQREASKAFATMSGGTPEQPGKTSKDPRTLVTPDTYEYNCIEAEYLAKTLNNIDLHKLTQGGWHYHMEEWRSSLLEITRGLDLLMRMAREQTLLFQRLHNILLGNETGRILPMPKAQKMTTPPPPKRGAPKAGGGKGKKKR